MDRLPFTLPDFCRVNWSSRSARMRWEHEIAEVNLLWQRLEIKTVSVGLRRAGLISVKTKEMHEYRERLAVNGLLLVELYSYDAKGTYVSDLNACHEGGLTKCCALARREHLQDVVAAFRENDSHTLGRLLGYPTCCIEFFDEVWNRGGYIDTSWAMALSSPSIEQTSCAVREGKVNPSTNMLLRWVGLRPVFHLPCSFDCKASEQVASEIALVGGEGRDNATVCKLYDILGWPVQWSALHGIAEIETAIFRLSTRTDATASKHTIRLQGSPRSIAAAPLGSRFPFSSDKSRSPIREKQIEAAVRSDKPPREELQDWYFTDNGFRSEFEMRRAFRPIVEAICATGFRSIFHIECRNGALLSQLVQEDDSFEVGGMDGDNVRIIRAQGDLTKHAERFWRGMFYENREPSRFPRAEIYLIMIGRLLEIPKELATEAIASFRTQSDVLMLYAFDDWTTKRPLAEMAAELGLDIDLVSDSVGRVK